NTKGTIDRCVDGPWSYLTTATDHLTRRNHTIAMGTLTHAQCCPRRLRPGTALRKVAAAMLFPTGIARSTLPSAAETTAAAAFATPQAAHPTAAKGSFTLPRTSNAD